MRDKMHLKKGLSLLAMSVAVMFLWVALSGAVVECPDDITINTEGWPKDKYEPTKLSHKKHATEYKVQCKDCHHVYKDGKNVWEEGQEVQKCSECHNVYKLGKDLREASDEEKKLSLYKAYHDNCKGCHKKMQKEQKETENKAPVKCAECHAKKPTAKK
jgi:hypothetical protein